MKEVLKSQMVIGVLKSSLFSDRSNLADLLGKTQKVLGEYLECERASFPLFYLIRAKYFFDILDNSKNIPVFRNI